MKGSIARGYTGKGEKPYEKPYPVTKRSQPIGTRNSCQCVKNNLLSINLML